MKILMVNKFLYPNGGSETYVFKLGKALSDAGHQVQYFGMDHEERCAGNRAGIYTKPMDFHSASGLQKLGYALKTIYSSEARRKIRLVLDDFRPDVCHLNNFNYQLTPSIILEIIRWRKQTGRKCKIIYTAHDYQLLCPNHSFNNPNNGENCEKCINGRYIHCLKRKCIHGSAVRSAVGMMEARFWHSCGVYKHIDTIICCSEFMKRKMDSNPLFAKKTVAMHNFVEPIEYKCAEKKEYVLYFGRYSQEKGINTLLKVCRELPHIQFVFAGSGPLARLLGAIPNIKNMGFQGGEALYRLIAEARFSVYPSEWYENCPFSVMESQMLGTPVLGADIGGIPELIQPGVMGELFKSGCGEALKQKIQYMWAETSPKQKYNCKAIRFPTAAGYIQELMKIYGE